MIVGRLLNKIINIFTGLFAIATLILMLAGYILQYVNKGLSGVVPLIPPDAILTVERFRNYFTLATVFCAGIEFTLKRNIFVAIGFAVIVAAVAGFMIYTDATYVVVLQ